MGFEAHARVVTNVKEEGGELCQGMDMVVVLELYIGQQFIPVILLVIAEQAQILFQLLVDLLSLPIGLGVVHCRGVQVHTKEAVQLTGEL